MYFHNVATHQCIPDRPSTTILPWQPFHMQSGICTEESLPIVDLRQYLESLRHDSEPLSRRSTAAAGTVYFHGPPSGDVEYVSSWPPQLSVAASVPSPESSPSVYYTPMSTPTLCESPTTTSTLSSPQTDDSPFLLSSPRDLKLGTIVDRTDLTEDEENRPPVEEKPATAPLRRFVGCRRHLHPARETTGLKGWKRLRRNAPPALRIAGDAATYTHCYILQLGDEDGLAKPSSRLALLRRGNTEEHRRRLLTLLINGVDN